ncbi:MAG: OPT/YSL family transporter, partial [Pyrinomonadaceae bacterium]|nr:OPT/YSL family transporter [Pyrinomonadaceae bacterium]
MSSGIVEVTTPSNEYPDIVGARPEDVHAATFHPYIPATTRLRELTPLPLIVGTLLGMIFGASSLYLVLKVGLTVSASIPVAVISITLFRLLSSVGLRNATILENNIVQTAGSAGESIAFGVGVTMPAIMILGFDLEFTRVMLVAVLGGLLGILMMIPLRRALIVNEHGNLPYPEGAACAQVLIAGEKGGEMAKTAYLGLAFAFAYAILQKVFHVIAETPGYVSRATSKIFP